MKTPLRYPGGKSRAVKTLMEFIPEDCGELCSPFLGGGSIELALAEKGIKVHAYDGFKPIVWFWQALLKDPERLATLADLARTKSKKKYIYQDKEYKARGLLQRDFDRFRDEIRFALRSGHPFSYEAAAKVYAINRSSFSGATLAGGFSERASYARFTDSQIEYIRNFKVDNLTVKHADFKDSIKRHDCCLYLDPPYFLEAARCKLYGDEGDMHAFFPHLALFSMLRERANWILSYNDCDEIRSLYRDFDIHEAEWTYGMNRSKKSSEIIITNLP
ncbi:MAG TPA: DNA adenine methylase [Flavobacteriales bacterium]|nr:DNA adenine methylase [Flavobacteriales bacterium]